MDIRILPDQLIGDWEPTGDPWEDRGASPLKANALRTLLPQLATLGFATGPFQRRKSFLRLPIHWVYRADRARPPHRHYEPVGAVTVPCRDSDPVPAFGYTYTCRWRQTFGQFFDRFLDPWQLDELFSEEGISEIRRFKRAVKSGKRCAEPEKIIRHEWVRRHPELWDDPRALLAELRRFKLYKSSTPVCQALRHLQLIIDRVRRGEGAEDFVQQPQGGGNVIAPDLLDSSDEEFIEHIRALVERERTKGSEGTNNL